MPVELDHQYNGAQYRGGFRLIETFILGAIVVILALYNDPEDSKINTWLLVSALYRICCIATPNNKSEPASFLDNFSTIIQALFQISWIVYGFVLTSPHWGSFETTARKMVLALCIADTVILGVSICLATVVFLCLLQN